MLAAALRQVIVLITGRLLFFNRRILVCWPVFCLPQALLFFASPKKSKQKKQGFEDRVLTCWSGFCLPQASLFFASPKKSKQKKGEPKAVALGAALRYSRRPGSGANSLRSNKRPP